MICTSRAIQFGIAGIALAALVGASVPASATTTDPVTSTATSIEALVASIDASSGTFDGDEARKLGASPADIGEFAASYEAAGARVVHVEVDSRLLAEYSAVPQSRSCVGKNTKDTTGLQYNVYIDSCVTQRVMSLIGAGAGAAGVVAAVTAATGVGPMIAGVIAGLLGVGAGVLGSCAAKGRGVAIHKIIYSAVTWCTGQ